MSAARHNKATKLEPDRGSGVRHAKPERSKGIPGKVGEVRLKEILPYVSDEVLRSVDEAIEAARDQLGVVFSSDGQVIMLPGLNDGPKDIPAERAADFADFMQRQLEPRNIKVQPCFVAGPGAGRAPA